MCFLRFLVHIPCQKGWCCPCESWNSANCVFLIRPWILRLSDSSGFFVSIHQTVWCHTPQYFNDQTDCHENIVSQIFTEFILKKRENIGAVCYCTAEQARRSRVWFSMWSLAALWPWGRLNPQQKWVPGIPPVGKGGRCLGLTTLLPSYTDCLRNYGSLLEPWRPVQSC